MVIHRVKYTKYPNNLYISNNICIMYYCFNLKLIALFKNKFIYKVMNTITFKNLFSILSRIFLSLCLILPLILFSKFLYTYNHYGISIYGLYLILYLLIQCTFSIINQYYNWFNWKLESEHVTPIKENSSKYNVIVVGRKENENYYKMCLESLKNTFSTKLNKIFVIIDGNEPDDHYMIDIFQKTFEKQTELKSLHIYLENSNNTDEYFITNYLQDISDNDIICISQKYSGKRSAMFTGFQLSLLEKNTYDKDIESVFCTDSDTVILDGCLEEMSKHFSKDNKIGAVCGNLSIYNKYDSTISFLTSIRYWYAFNLERAYQSLTGSVLCVSGPIGIYKLDSIEKVFKDWSKQQFLGKLCNYGDDRHLTNKILALGEKVIYTPFGCASTETPDNLYRFYKQQIRWNKSAFREFFWTIGILHKHSLFMTVDLVYTIFYPVFCISYLMYILWKGSLLDLGLYLTIVLSLGLAKSIYGYMRTKNLETLFYFLYTLIYISIIFPAKIYALLNINDNSWGTSSRKFLNDKFTTDKFGLDIIVLISWNIILLSGFSFNIYTSTLPTNVEDGRGTISSHSNHLDYLFTIIISIVFLLSFITMYIYIFLKRQKNDL